MRERRPSVLAAVVVALLALASGAAHAQDLDVSVSLSLEGIYRPGYWSYARVSVTNPHKKSIESEVRVTVRMGSESFRTVVPFKMGPGPGSKKTKFVYFLPSAPITDLQVVVEHPDGRQLLPPPQSLPSWHESVVAVASSRSTRAARMIKDAYAQRGNAEFQAVYIPLSILPDQRLGLDPLAALYLPEGGVGLDLAQANAVIHWVACGGHLVLGSASTLQELADSPLLDLFPVLPERQGEIADPSGLAEWFLASGLEDLPVTMGRPLGGEVTAWEGDVPVIVKQPYGQGRVTFLAFRLDQIQSNRTTGFQRFWRDTVPLEGGNEGASNFDYGPAIRLVQGALENFEQGQPIPIAWIVLFIIAYVVVIGPVDYLVLRKLDRMEWTWVTFTASVVAFSAIAYFGSVLLRGTKMLVREVVIVDADPGSGWITNSTFVGVFSPQNRTLGFRGITPDTSMAPLVNPGGGASVMLDEPPELRMGPPAELHDPLRIWTPRSLHFRTSDRQKAFPAEFHPVGNRGTLVLRNPFGQPIRDARLYHGESVFPLGEIPAGAEREWSSLPAPMSLQSWLSGEGITIPTSWPGMYRGQSPLHQRGLAAAATFLTFLPDPKLESDENVPQMGQFPMGMGGWEVGHIHFPGQNRRAALQGGGALVTGWIDDPPAGYQKVEWEAAETDRVGYVRILVPVKETP